MRRRTALVAVGCIAVVAVIWAWTRLADRTDEPAPAAVEEPGVSHVHGLGVNPGDGALIVATHYGSFRIAADGDEAVRIGDSFQDTMGLTVAGADDFLGSGHPDAQGVQEGQPGRLGLIESTDGGATWASLSLRGEVDFHALAFAHDQVYGLDSGTGRFMVSTDRSDWETRASVDLFGFAVDPDDAERIVGVGVDGLEESIDGGRSWAAVDGPPLVTVSWDATVGLWGAGPDGAVWRDDEAGWERAGQLAGQPQAFLATADALYAAASDGDDVTGIYRSTDEGRAWDLLISPP